MTLEKERVGEREPSKRMHNWKTKKRENVTFQRKQKKKSKVIIAYIFIHSLKTDFICFSEMSTFMHTDFFFFNIDYLKIHVHIPFRKKQILRLQFENLISIIQSYKTSYPSTEHRKIVSKQA